MKTKRSNAITILSLLFSCFLAIGCGEGGGGGGGGGGSTEAETVTETSPFAGMPTTSMAVEFRIPDDSVDAIEGVDRVIVSVIYNGASIGEYELQRQDGVWVGNLEGLPVGVTFDFVAQAYSSSGAVVYEAASVESVNETATSLNLDAVQKTMDVEFSIQLPENLARARNLVSVATPDEIVNVFANVAEGGNVIVSNQPLTKQPGSFEWTGTFADLPVGPTLTFSARGTNISAANIYTGQTDASLASSGNNVVVSMAPENDGAALGFVRITQIRVPAALPVLSTTSSIGVVVDGNSFEEVGGVMTAGGDGNFDFATTSTLNFFGNATLGATYNTPSIAGSYLNTVAITSLARDTTIEWTFPTNIVSATTTNSGARVIINPVITNLNATLNTSNNAVFTASLFNLGEAYDYAWSFTPSTTANVQNVNSPQTFIPNYDPSIAGTLTLEVNVQGDTSRKTTLHYGIQNDLFPNNVIQTF